MEVIRRKVRSEICPVAEDCAVLHQAIAQENLLPAGHILAREKHLSVRIHYLKRERWLVGIGPIGEKSQHKETEEKNDSDRLHPASSDKKSSLCGLIHDRFLPQTACS